MKLSKRFKTDLSNAPASMMPSSVRLWIGHQTILTDVHVAAKQSVLRLVIRSENNLT